MPLFSIKTSLKIEDKKKLLEKTSKFVSELTNKPERYVMVSINDCFDMFFDGSDSPSCFVEIKSIGSLIPSTMTTQICKFISSELGISEKRIYVNFEDINAANWGWNNNTFG